MGLRTLKLKSVFYSDEDNLLTDFYIPVLSSSISYDRLAGYFSSNTLAIAAKGIAAFIKNGGKIRLITNVVLSVDDQKAIGSALMEKEERVLDEIENIEDELKRDHIRMFSWMIKEDLLELKVAVVKEGIAHRKVGILRDPDGNTIAFSGSDNETVRGWLFNDEQFHLFCSWKPGDKEHLWPDVEHFENLWRDSGKNIRVYGVSEAFKNGLIKTAPANNEEFRRLSKNLTDALVNKYALFRPKASGKSRIRIRDYQLEAIRAWKDNACRGILAMATGSGKTYTSLFAVQEYRRNVEGAHLLVICCPYQHLVDQWERNVRDIFENVTIVKCYDHRKGWYGPLNQLIQDIIFERTNFGVAITTTATGSTQLFLNIINTTKVNKIVVGDEVHNLGTDRNKKFLNITAKASLGLSATPIRPFDEEGNKTLQEYFGPPIYTLDIKQAIAMGFLVPYRYYVRFCELTEGEYKDYRKISARIAQLYKEQSVDDEKLQYLLRERAKLTSSCLNKLKTFRDILDSINDLYHLLVYTAEDPAFFAESLNILEEKQIIALKITGDVRKEKRPEIIKKLEVNDIQCIIAMRCLDEGVDIPSADKAIILASSTNSKQYIQRRGRILRNTADRRKKISTIYDTFVLPPQFADEIDKALYERELKRVLEFASAASNYDVISNIIAFSRKHTLMKTFSKIFGEFEL